MDIFLPVAAENPETWLFCLSCALVMILIKWNSISERVFLPYFISRMKFIQKRSKIQDSLKDLTYSLYIGTRI